MLRISSFLVVSCRSVAPRCVTWHRIAWHRAAPRRLRLGLGISLHVPLRGVDARDAAMAMVVLTTAVALAAPPGAARKITAHVARFPCAQLVRIVIASSSPAHIRRPAFSAIVSCCPC